MTTRTVSGSITSNIIQGVAGIPGLNSSVPFELQDWKLTAIRWDQLFALSSKEMMFGFFQHRL